LTHQVTELRLRLLGVGAMHSPRYAPAGLLLCYGHSRVAFDGGPGAEPDRTLDAWLVTDASSELRREISRLAAARGLEPVVGSFTAGDLSVQPRPVAHTSHPTVGYMIRAAGRRVAWAPEFWTFPDWAADVDLLFADAAGWDRPIRFVGGVGGHASALAVAREAHHRGVKRLVFAHIGRPTIRAIDKGARPPFGEFGEDGRGYRLRAADGTNGPTIGLSGADGGKTDEVASEQMRTVRQVLDAFSSSRPTPRRSG
jgi:Beta-lactamase superfamily domain